MLAAAAALAAPLGAQTGRFPAASEERVSPGDVFAACRHRVASETGTPLWNLCSGIRVPPQGSGFVPAAAQRMAQLDVPDANQIREFARNAEKEVASLPLLGGFMGEAPEIRFAQARADLDSLARQLIADAAADAREHLARHPEAVVVVKGFASPEGGTSANQDIARQRANAVAAELVKHGVDRNRIFPEAAPSPLLEGVVTAAEREASRGATVAVRAPRVTLSPGVVRTRPAPGLQPELNPAGLAAAARADGVAPSLSLSSLAVHASDVLVERAGEQMQVYVVRQLANRLCPAFTSDTLPGAAGEPAERARRFGLRSIARRLHATCSLLRQDGVGFGTAGIPELRTALARDLRQLPESIVFEALQTRMNVAGETGRYLLPADAAVAGRYVDFANAALALLTFVSQVEDGRDPLSVIAQFNGAVLVGPAGIRWSLSSGSGEMPLTNSLQRFGAFAARIDRARTDLAGYGMPSWSMSDTVFTYALRTLAVSVQDGGDQRLRQLLGTEFEQVDRLLAGYRDMTDAVQRARSIVGRLDTLTVSGANSREVRKELYAAALMALSEAGPALFLAGDMGGYDLRPVLQPARRLIVSARTGEYGEALYALLDLVRTPGVAVGPLAGIGEQAAAAERRVAELRRQAESAQAQADTIRKQLRRLQRDAGPEVVARLRTERERLLADAGALRSALAAELAGRGPLGQSAAAIVAFPHYGGEGEAVRVLSLAASVVNASSEAQVTDALRTFVGQGRDFVSKREVGRSTRVSLNSYVGLGSGLEILESAPEVGRRRGGYFALSVPIGIEIGWPCGKGFSCGAYLPLVDLGAIAATRFGGGDVESTPDIAFERIITPGLFAVFGLPRAPVSLGVGMTWAPESRARRDTGEEAPGTERDLNAFRFGAFLGIDIPIFP